MNILKVVVIGFLLTSASAFSQYNNNYYNYNRYGRPNSNFGRDYSTPSKPSPEEVEKAKAQQIERIIANLKEELKLDELQTIAIKNEITTSMKNIDIVIKKETSDEDKKNEIKALTDRTEIVINSYLNPEQKEKYKTIIAESKMGKKDKKDKKKEKATEE